MQAHTFNSDRVALELAIERFLYVNLHAANRAYRVDLRRMAPNVVGAGLVKREAGSQCAEQLKTAAGFAQLCQAKI